MVRISGFHPDNRGSNPLGVTIVISTSIKRFIIEVFRKFLYDYFDIMITIDIQCNHYE